MVEQGPPEDETGGLGAVPKRALLAGKLEPLAEADSSALREGFGCIIG